jgi:hypothetical protein
MRSLLAVAKRNHRIDSRRAPGGQVAGDDGHAGEDDQHSGEWEGDRWKSLRT